MKKYRITSQFLLLILTGVCVFVACTANLDYEVGQSIQGTYTVYFGQSTAPVGYLTLSSGQYLFEPDTHSTQNIKSAESRFFFISQSKGTYYIEYHGSITANSLLENLDNNEILAMILFNEAPAETQPSSSPNNRANRTFLIRNNQQDESLYFHSTASEIELWRIEKSWNNKTE